MGDVCSYEMSTFTSACNYCSVTGVGSSIPPAPDDSCETGAVWGKPIANDFIGSSTTESSVNDCYFKCVADPLCRQFSHTFGSTSSVDCWLYPLDISTTLAADKCYENGTFCSLDKSTYNPCKNGGEIGKLGRPNDP